METILRKISSRKLWLALAGVATGIAMAFGVDAGEVATVAGAVTTILSVTVYVAAEGKVDAAAVGQAAEQVQLAADLVSGESGADDADPA
jgi:phage shock protein PspC (stress-responsive transcriptional regulator)